MSWIASALAWLLGSASGAWIDTPPGPAEKEGHSSTPDFVLRAEWGALGSTTYGIEKHARVAALLHPEPAAREAGYGHDDILALLPPEGASPGEVWDVPLEALLPFLRQLHPGATGDLHHYSLHVQLADLPPEVTTFESAEGPIDVAALRARGETELRVRSVGAALGARATFIARGIEERDGGWDILLRVHAEFELVADLLYYTPGQFEGRLVVDPASRRVRFFSLAVPDRNTNVDVNARDPESGVMQADIGHVERLGLWSASAAPAADADLLAAARRRLLEAFYPWYRVAWSDLATAWRRAQESAKPIHLVVLFGVLDDESC